MKSLRDFLAGHGELMFEALELATCGYYVRPLRRQPSMLSLSPDGMPVLLSRQCFLSLGHEVVDDADAEAFWCSLLHPDDANRVETVICDATAKSASPTMDPLTFDYRLRCADGSYRYTRETARIVQPKSGDEAYWIGVLADIDTQVAFEGKLTSQNHEIETILDTIPTYIWVKDHESRILKVNRAAANASGMTSEKMTGRLTAEVYPDQAKRYLRSDDRLTHEFPVHSSAEILVSADGTKRRMLVDKYKLQSKADLEPRILVVGTDVTEIERAQLALRKSESQFRSVFDSSPIGMLLVDSDGQIELSNDEADKMFAYPSGDLVGRTIEDLVPAARRENHRRLRSNFLAETGDGRRMGYGREFTALRADGSTITVEVSLTRITVDDQRMTLASVFDISERAETATRLKLAVEVGNIGFWEFKLSDQSVELSPQVLSQLGLTEPWTDLHGFREQAHPDDVDDVLDKVDRYIRDEISIFEAVFRLKHADGTYRWFLSRGTKILDDTGVPVRMVGFHIDITKQQMLQLELERSNHDLDRFAYIASHDLKAPLRGIQHISQWIEEDLGDKIDDQIREHLSLLQSQSSRMNLLLDDLLAYARVGRQSEDCEIVDMKSIVEELFQFMTPPPHVRLKIEGDLPVFRTTRPPLEQVIRNLIGNAIHHAGAENSEIRVSCSRQDSRYRFCIQDFGEGIAPEYHEKIFELFRSLQRRDRNSGTGMGLALVKRLCEHAGGRVWVESKVGKGAKFFFTWPEIRGE